MEQTTVTQEIPLKGGSHYYNLIKRGDKFVLKTHNAYTDLAKELEVFSKDKLYKDDSEYQAKFIAKLLNNAEVVKNSLQAPTGTVRSRSKSRGKTTITPAQSNPGSKRIVSPCTSNLNNNSNRQLTTCKSKEICKFFPT